MRLAARTVLDKLQEDPTILPDNITVDAVYTLLNFFLPVDPWDPTYSCPSRDICN